MEKEKEQKKDQHIEEKPEEKEQNEMEKKEEKKEATVASLEKKLEEKEKELAECKDKMLRLAAELENFKKRVEREKVEHMKFALEEFAKELLPFLDNLERAVALAKDTKDMEKMIEGIELTLSGYFKTLERFGLKTFVAEGKRFDPNYHEALSVEENSDVEDNTVLKELLRGYTLHDRVIRPALVVVSKKNQQGNEKEGGQEESNA
ncbi:MAG: nucleotide exchange factor GrpE [Thermodesulfobacteria bacterium]|nr:nucleotide exchange factor GrpE [Thermodesulfobacteriota bacterium]